MDSLGCNAERVAGDSLTLQRQQEKYWTSKLPEHTLETGKISTSEHKSDEVSALLSTL